MRTHIPDLEHGPEFCPNPDCPHHTPTEATKHSWYSRFGSFTSKTWGKTPRFICTECGKTCSTNTFSIHYWAQSKVDIQDLDHRLNSCGGYRQIGRSVKLSYAVLKNRYLRLARNYLNLFDSVLAGIPLAEDIAFDGFESFINSQYTPNNFNIAVGTVSQLPYAVSMSLMRRKGRMTDAQKRNRALLDAVWKPTKGELVGSCKTVFRSVLSLYMNRKTLSPFVINTDEKKEYPWALGALAEYRHLSEINAVSHVTVSSKAERTRKNPLFPVNYLDREIRKNSAAHVRETVRYDREVGMSLSRMAITLGYHSFHKPFRIKNRVSDAETHAGKMQFLSGVEARIAFDRLYTGRHVWTRQKLKSPWMEEIWLRKKENPPMVDFKTGEVREKGQPGKGWVARHLVA